MSAAVTKKIILYIFQSKALLREMFWLLLHARSTYLEGIRGKNRKTVSWSMELFSEVLPLQKYFTNNTKNINLWDQIDFLIFGETDGLHLLVLPQETGKKNSLNFWMANFILKMSKKIIIAQTISDFYNYYAFKQSWGKIFVAVKYRYWHNCWS